MDGVQIILKLFLKCCLQPFVCGTSQKFVRNGAGPQAASSLSHQKTPFLNVLPICPIEYDHDWVKMIPNLFLKCCLQPFVWVCLRHKSEVCEKCRRAQGSFKQKTPFLNVLPICPTGRDWLRRRRYTELVPEEENNVFLKFSTTTPLPTPNLFQLEFQMC